MKHVQPFVRKSFQLNAQYIGMESDTDNSHTQTRTCVYIIIVVFIYRSFYPKKEIEIKTHTFHEYD